MGRSAKSRATTSGTGTAMDPDLKPPASKRKASEIGGKKPKRQRKMSTAPDGASNSRVKIRSRNTVKSKRKLQTESKSGNILTKGKKVSKTEMQNEVVSAETFKLEGVSSLPKQERPSGKGTESSSQEGYSAKRHKLVGCHTSIAGALVNAVNEAVELGARAFGMFLKSQRQWNSKPLGDDAAEKFKVACKEHGFAPHHIVPHGSYLMNCGSPKDEMLEKSRAMLVDEMQRCEKLGLAMFNFHPGSTCGEISIDESLDRIAESINQAHKKSKNVIAVVENMSCQGNTVGGNFEELGQIIQRVKDKSRVGVCLDTCHAFAAGYNLKSEDGFHKMMDAFERDIGLKYLKAVHVNDSKGEAGCHLDRHENIGRGKIGIEAFRRIMNDPRFDNIPFVLETPQCDYAKEIKKLYSLCDS